MDQIASIEGVKQVNPLIFGAFSTQVKGEIKNFGIIGYALNKSGGLTEIIEGRPIIKNRYEVVADRYLRFKVGDKIPLENELFEVVGIAKGMCLTGDIPFLFMSLDNGQRIFFGKGKDEKRWRQNNVRERFRLFISFISSNLEDINTLTSGSNFINAAYLTVKDGYSPQEVAKRISSQLDLNCFTQEEEITLIFNNFLKMYKEQMEMFRMMMIVISGVIISLVVFSATIEKTKEIATLKVIGIPYIFIIGMIVNHVVLIGLVAAGVGTILLLLIKDMFFFPLVVSINEIIFFFMGITLTCILSSLLAIKQVLKIDPMIALER
ncbi:hypothetical protein KKE26_01615 [bacterium]|nr:hypothetical protein [bacterium]